MADISVTELKVGDAVLGHPISAIERDGEDLYVTYADIGGNPMHWKDRDTLPAHQVTRA